jgi:hypothetical protein
VLATLAMSVLLLVVAFSNLEARDAEIHKAAQQEQVPALDAYSDREPSAKRRAS